MQEPQLHDNEEQEEAYRAAGDEEVLQYVPQANGTQGSEVVCIRRSEGKTGFEFRGVVQRSGLRSPKPGMGVRIPPPLPELRRSNGERERKKTDRNVCPTEMNEDSWPRGR